MTNEQALQFKKCIDVLSEIAYASPSPGSLRDDGMYGNEFKTEYIKVVKKAADTLKDLTARLKENI